MSDCDVQLQVQLARASPRARGFRSYSINVLPLASEGAGLNRARQNIQPTYCYSTLRIEALVATATRDFAHTILPASLKIPARQVAAFRDHAGTIFSLFESFEMTPQPNRERNSVHLSLETNTITAHCKMVGKINAESELGQKFIASGLAKWRTECVLFVQMSPNGKRIIEVREFLHNAKAEELQQRLSGVLIN